MAKLSLKPSEGESSTAIVETPQLTTSQLVAQMAVPSAFEGDFTASDIRIPKLSLVSKQSKIMDDRPEWLGHFVYDNAVSLGKSINVVFFKIKKFFEEKLPDGSTDMPQRFDTLAEARASGSVFKDAAYVDLMIEVSDQFDGGEEVEPGKFYIPARLTAKGTSYWAVVPVLLKDASVRLKGNLTAGSYKMDAERRQNDQTSWYTPKLSANGRSSQEVQDFIANRF